MGVSYRRWKYRTLLPSLSHTIFETRVKWVSAVLVVGVVATLLLLYLFWFSITYDDSWALTKWDELDASMLEVNFTQDDNSQKVTSIPLPCAGSHDFNVSGDSEVTRRLVETNLRDAWFFFSNHMKDLQSRNWKMNQFDFEAIMKEGAERMKVLQSDVWLLSQLNGEASRREQEARELSVLVQNRLHRLQNPKDCATAKKLLCKLNRDCGLGCEIHHVLYCFMTAYGTHRTLILKSDDWNYSSRGWEEIFLPLSNTCTTISNDTVVKWPGNKDTQIVEFPMPEEPEPKPQHMPLAIPRDISERLIHLHGNPGAWWLGQFLKYMFRLQPYMQHSMNKREQALNFQHPIVGVHVRRTDKINEAQYYQLEEYMEQVEEYFAGLQVFNPNVTRRIYLASDEPRVFEEAKKKYPEYEILYNTKSIEVVRYAKRFTLASLRDLVVDIYFLSRTDYIVVTLSSNIGRLAYEIMQSLAVDASSCFYSLDTTYYFHFQRPSYVRTRFFHQPDRETIIHRGEKLQMRSWYSDFRKGLSAPLGEKAVELPYYKLEPIVDIINVPSYSYLDNQPEVE
ncbi:alpha-(1,6)-fucosyltransferase [Cherax quadricarinatus]|uniref:alpha-(1,6)-fucosyltransferase n=1 Tax=Cherax quadricarinatus TaxID=27406 RepID=UPI00387E4918